LPAHAQDSLWVLAGRQSSAIDMLQTDTQGYWYVAGNFQNYLKIGNTFIEEDKGRYFVVKYEPSTAKPIWIKQFAQPIKKMVVSANGVYIAGNFKQSLALDAVELTAYGEYSSYLAKINIATGDFDWIKTLKADKDALIGGLATDYEGNICLTGNFVGVLRIGERALRPIKFKNIYLAKFDASGNLLWVTQGTAGRDEITGISVWSITTDSKGNVILTGTLCGTGFLGTMPLTSGEEKYAGEGTAYTTDIFLAKFAPNGEAIWAKSIANQAEVQSLTTDTLGSVYLAGNFRGSESDKHQKGHAMFDDFKSLKITKKIDRQSIETCFIAKYSSLGNLIWVKGAESSGESRGTRLVWDIRRNCLYVAGFYYRDIKFGSFELATTEKEAELFIVTFAPNGTPKELYGTQSPHDKIMKDMHLTPFGDLYGVGLFKTNFNINKIELATENPNVCGFLVKLNK